MNAVDINPMKVLAADDPISARLNRLVTKTRESA